MPADTPLFDVSKGLARILDRDLRLADIPKRDERGRTIDVHSLRHTFGTHLSKGGVPLRTAQAAMRHSDPSLTANVYTDPKLLDVAGSLDVLPRLPVDDEPDQAKQRATGTYDHGKLGPRALAPMLAPTFGKRCKLSSNPDNIAERTTSVDDDGGMNVSADLVKTKRASSITDNARFDSGRLDSNQRPPDPQSGALTRLRHAPSTVVSPIRRAGRSHCQANLAPVPSPPVAAGLPRRRSGPIMGQRFGPGRR